MQNKISILDFQNETSTTFEEFLTAKGLSGRTISECIKYYNRFKDIAMTNANIIRLINTSPTNRVLRYTITKYIQYLRYLEPDNPYYLRLEVPKLSGRKQQTITKYVTREEVKKLVNSLLVINDKENALMVLLLFETGLRANELTHLKVKDIEIESKSLHGFGKGRKEFLIPLQESTYQFLQSYILQKNMTPEQRIFPLNVDTLWHRMVKISQRYLGKKVHTHMLRHGFGTYLIREGLDILEVKEMMRHGDIKSTSIYAHIDKDATIKKFKETMEKN